MGSKEDLLLIIFIKIIFERVLLSRFYILWGLMNSLLTNVMFYAYCELVIITLFSIYR